MQSALKNRLRAGTSAVEPKPPGESIGQRPALSAQIPELSAADQAAAAALRQLRRRGLLREHEIRREPKPERFLAWRDLFERGLVSSKTQARRLWERGLFPRPVHLSERVIAFRESEVDAWAAARKNDAASN